MALADHFGNGSAALAAAQLLLHGLARQTGARNLQVAKMTSANQPAGSTHASGASVDGWALGAVDCVGAVGAIMAASLGGMPFAAYPLTLERLANLRRNSRLRHAYRDAALLFAGSRPVAALAQGTARARRIERSRVMIELAAAAARARLPVFLVGANGADIAELGRDLGDATDGLIDIAGSVVVGEDFDPDGAHGADAITRIAASGAGLCILILGSPTEELFARRAADSGAACGFVCLGGVRARSRDTASRSIGTWLNNSLRRTLLLAELAVVAPLRRAVSRHLLRVW